VGLGVGVGPGLKVVVALGEGLGVELALGDELGLALWVCVGAGVAVGVRVGTGVGGNAVAVDVAGERLPDGVGDEFGLGVTIGGKVELCELPQPAAAHQSKGIKNQNKSAPRLADRETELLIESTDLHPTAISIFAGGFVGFSMLSHRNANKSGLVPPLT